MENKNNTFREIWEKLKTSKKVLMSLHLKPDLDSLGSCLAMKKVLEHQGILVKVISGDPLSDYLQQFEFSKEVEINKSIFDIDLNKFDVVLILDTGSLSQLSPRLISEKFPENVFLINIDHHYSNSSYGNLNYIDKKAPSTCSILLNLFKHQKIKFDKDLCKRLLIGICSDTGLFIYDNNPLRAMKDVVFLIEESGINFFEEIVTPLKSGFPLKMKKYFGLLFQNLEILDVGKYKVGYTFVTEGDRKRLGLEKAEINSGIQMISDLKDVDIVFMLSESEDMVKGSFRTQKDIDVSEIAKKFEGGGGHQKAAGFPIPKMPLEEAKKKVIEVIKTFK